MLVALINERNEVEEEERTTTLEPLRARWRMNVSWDM